MRTPLVASILVSLVLVGGAVGYRVSNIEEKKVALETIESKNIDWQDISTQVASNASSTTKSASALNKTDLIGRQLIFDYVELATSGQASDETIDRLAEKYVESIPTLISAEKIDVFDIRSVPDTQANLKSYGDNLNQIYTEFVLAIAEKYSGNKIEVALTNNPEALAGTMGKAYEKAAASLRNLSVPNSLLAIHVKFVNNYLSSAAALKSISLTDKDPAVAFAGLVAFNSNNGEEELIMGEISKILTSKGL
jgi:hypothetical protein